MLELVYGKSAGGSLKIAAKKRGFAGEVICPELALSVGSLRDFAPETGRAEVLRRLYGAVYRGGDQAAEEQAQHNRDALSRLQLAAETGEPVRVWTAPAAEEWCLFLLAMSLLQNASGPVSAVCIPLLQPRPDGTLCALRGLGELSPQQWHTFLPLEQSVSLTQRKAWANLWNAALGQSAPVRVLFNGNLLGVPEHFFDSLLWESLPPRKSFSAGEAVGCALSRLPGVPDGFLAGRLRRWTEQRLLRVQRKADHYYETVLARTEQ